MSQDKSERKKEFKTTVDGIPVKRVYGPAEGNADSASQANFPLPA